MKQRFMQASFLSDDSLLHLRPHVAMQVCLFSSKAGSTTGFPSSLPSLSGSSLPPSSAPVPEPPSPETGSVVGSYPSPSPVPVVYSPALSSPTVAVVVAGSFCPSSSPPLFDEDSPLFSLPLEASLLLVPPLQTPS